MKYLTVVLAGLLLSSSALPQKTLQDWAQQDDKKFYKKFVYSGNLSYVKKDIKNLQSPLELEEIGLFSFTMIQPNFTKRNSAYVRYLTNAGEVFIVDLLYDKLITGLKSGAEKMSVELKTVDEYLDTPEKKTAYANTDLDPSQWTKVASSISNYLSGEMREYSGKGTPEGYRYVMNFYDTKTWRAIGGVTDELGIDGSLVIDQTIWWNGKIFALGPVRMAIIGPNPVPFDENEKYVNIGPLKGYLEGLVYGAVELSPPKPYELARMKKKEVTEINTEYLDVVYGRILQGLLNHINEEYDKMIK